MEETARKDARDLEYLRFNDLLTFRQNIAINRNIDFVMRNPLVLVEIANLTNLIWDFMRPYSLEVSEKNDKDAMDIIEEAIRLSGEVKQKKRRLGSGDNLTVRVNNFFKMENVFYRRIMEIRHAKNMDISLVRPVDPFQAIENMAKGGERLTAWDRKRPNQ